MSATSFGTSEQRWLPVLWTVTIALVCVGQWQMLEASSLTTGVVLWLVGLGAFVWLQWPTRDGARGCAADPEARLGRAGWACTGVALVAGITLWVRARGRDEGADWTDVMVLWLVSLAAIIAAATSPWSGRSVGSVSGRLRRAVASRPTQLASGLFVLALVVRLVGLDRFPAANGDGISHALIGRQFVRGEVTNPFTTLWYDNPTLYPFLQSGVFRLFGESLFTARLISAVVGALTVLFTYLMARRLLGVRVALIASALLAVLPFHLFFSRNAINFVEDAMFLVLVLWLLDRALVDGRRTDAAAAGLALGLSQYFYFGARLLPFIAVALVVYLAAWRRRGGESMSTVARTIGRQVLWTAATAILAVLPLVAHFADQPEDLTSRQDQVAFFGPYLDLERERTGDSAAQLVGRQALDAVLLPFATDTQGHYHPGAPLVGLPLAVPVAAGVAVATMAAARRRYFSVTVAWWATILGVGLTSGVETQRWTIAAPLVAVMAAIGLDAMWRVLVHRLAVPRRWATMAVTSIVVIVMAWSVTWFFRDARTLDAWSDTNSLVAHRLADSLEDEPAGTAVYTAFAPRMTFTSHSTVPFLADHVVGAELLEPLAGVADAPAVAGRTVFAFLPERLAELDVVRAAHPGGTVAETRYRDQLLFVTYSLR